MGERRVRRPSVPYHARNTPPFTIFVHTQYASPDYWFDISHRV